MKFFKQLFTWWNGQTVGTRLFTARSGTKVGTDAQGNVYYCVRKKGEHERDRRWVIFNGVTEASRIPPDWHGWIHHIYDEPPSSNKALTRKKWEKPHKQNMTGTSQSYHPPGSLLTPQDRPKVAADYEAWTPN